MTNPKVSVVIPTYNRASLICDALESVAAQSFTDIEIIVVDDGSIDNTAEVVKAWSGEKFHARSLRYLRQENLGGNAARNCGIEASTGLYVAFLDSDDIWHPEKLAKQIPLLEANTDCVAVYSGLREVEIESGKILSVPEHPYPSGKLLPKLLVSDVTAPTSAYLVRREALHRAGLFDLSLAARQDWDMWIRLAKLGEINAVREPLFDLRHHDGPRTISDPNRELQAHRRIIEKYADERRALGFSTSLAAKASYHRRCAKVHFHNKNAPLSAIGHYLAAIAYWPFEINSWLGLVSVFVPQGARGSFRKSWNAILGRTSFGIRSH